MVRLALSVALLLLPPGCAAAQVVINHAALDQLAGISAPPPAAAPATHRMIVILLHRHNYKRVAKLTTVKPAPAAAIVPLAAKPAAIAPAAPAAPPLPATAAISFVPGAADLPAGAPAALKPFCAASATITISAAAPVDPADPSSAMRLAMQRAFAVRDALIACGTSSANILPRTNTSSLAKNPDTTQITESR